jgi:hypothetical protein
LKKKGICYIIWPITSLTVKVSQRRMSKAYTCGHHMAQIAPVLAGYQFFEKLLDPVLTIKKKRELLLCSIFYFIYLQWFRVSTLKYFMLILTRPVLTNLITVGYPWPVLTNWL